jgi:hypothetical protein
MMQPDRSEPPKRAAIYTRSSQLKQVGGTHSIQAQIDLCKAYCAEHGYALSEDQMYYEALGLATEAAEKQRVKKNKTASALSGQSTASAKRAVHMEERNEA